MIDVPEQGTLADDLINAAAVAPFFAVDAPLQGLLAHLSDVARLRPRPLERGEALNAAVLLAAAVARRTEAGRAPAAILLDLKLDHRAGAGRQDFAVAGYRVDGKGRRIAGQIRLDDRLRRRSEGEIGNGQRAGNRQDRAILQREAVEGRTRIRSDRRSILGNLAIRPPQQFSREGGGNLPGC